MNVIVVSTLSGFILALVPLLLARPLRERLGVKQRMFLRIGLWFLLIQMFQIVILGNLSSSFPVVDSWSEIVKALFYGVFMGLFMELFRYVLLDRVFRHIRTYKESLYFGFCAAALTTVIMGFVLFLGSFGLNMVANTSDLSTLVGSSTPEDLQQAMMFQSQARELLAQPAVYGFIPLVERSSFLLFDMALTALIVFGLAKGETKYAWAAVFARASVTSCFYLLSSVSDLASAIGLLVLGAMSLWFIFHIQRSFPKHQH